MVAPIHVGKIVTIFVKVVAQVALLVVLILVVALIRHELLRFMTKKGEYYGIL